MTPSPDKSRVVFVQTKALVDPDWDTRSIIKQQALRLALDKLNAIIITSPFERSFRIRIQDDTVEADDITPFRVYNVEVSIWKGQNNDTTDSNAGE